MGGDSPDIRVKVIAYRQSVGASDLLTWDKSTCIRTYINISYCPETLSFLLTCLWNMAGAVEPLLYSRRKDIGVMTLCWRSLTWREVITVEISHHSTLTERNACIRSALMLAKAFPFTTTVYVSSFSVDIKLPNQDLLVSSGEDSGVWCTLTTSEIRRLYSPV